MKPGADVRAGGADVGGMAGGRGIQLQGRSRRIRLSVRRTHPPDESARRKCCHCGDVRCFAAACPTASAARPSDQRGLIGLFFCSSIEDQFEHVMSEWVEKMPMGPPSRGNAKDPLVGNNDDRELTFHIPVPNGPGFSLDGFAPFVTTHGTLYALFPSRARFVKSRASSRTRRRCAAGRLRRGA